MDRKTIFEMYGKYYDPIQSLASFGVLEMPTVDQVFNNKSLVQSVYRDMKEIKFKGTAIEYVSWVSLVFLIDALKREVPAGGTILDWTLSVIDNYDKHRTDCRNFWRNWAYNLHFPSSFRAEVAGLPYPSDSTFEDDWGGTGIDNIKEWMRSDAALSAFGELMVYEDVSGKKSEDYDELVGFIKNLATAKV